MKIYIHYKITDKPWGGGNSFLKAFKKYCISNKIQLVKSVNDQYDIFFFNACSKSQRESISIDELLRVKNYGRSNRLLNRILTPQKKILVYRSDGFRDEYADIESNIGDMIQKLSLHVADHVIFQNEQCLKSAQREGIGYCKNNYSIIYNGVNQDLFQIKTKDFWDMKRPLRVFSANWSPNPNKGYSTIAEFSMLKGVESYFCGNWPDHIDRKNVNVSPAMSQVDLAKEYQKYDVFLHPSLYDQSPNVCLEALSSGLPFIYHPTSGIKEVAGDCGIAIDETDLSKTYNSIKENYSALLETIKCKRDFYSMDRCAKEYIDVFKTLIKIPAEQND